MQPRRKAQRATQAEDAEGRTWEWRWGPGAACEVGEEGITKFVAEFMVGNADAEEGNAAGGDRRRAGGGKLAECR
jgi:hypothetical protein